MNIVSRLKYTKLLVLVSIVCIPATLVLKKVLNSEPYPFTSWKLYTQPHSVNNKYDAYRIYLALNDSSEYVRMPNDIWTKGMSRDDKFYFLRTIVEDTINIESNKKKFVVLCHFLYPEYQHYRLVKEEYQPSKLKNDREPNNKVILIESK